MAIFRRRKYLLLSLITLVPPIGIIIPLVFGAKCEFKLFINLFIASVISALGLQMLLACWYYLHETRTRNKTGPKEWSIYLGYLLMAVLIFYFISPFVRISNITRPASGWEIIPLLFLPFFATLPMLIGYLLGWMLEITVRRRNEVYKQQDYLNRKEFYARFSKRPFRFVLIFLVITAFPLLTANYYITKFSKTWGILSERNITIAIRNGNICEVERFIDEGADINTPSYNELTALHEAAFHNQKEMIEFLISKGAQIDAMDYIGETPLHKAAGIGNKAAVVALLKNGADVNAIDHHGQTPIYEAARKGHIEVAKQLLAYSAVLNVKDNKGRTPLGRATLGQHKDMVRLFIEHGARE